MSEFAHTKNSPTPPEHSKPYKKLAETIRLFGSTALERVIDFVSVIAPNPYSDLCQGGPTIKPDEPELDNTGEQIRRDLEDEVDRSDEPDRA